MEWISVKDKLPPHSEKIRIKAEYNGKSIEAEAIFNIYDIDEDTEAWAWTLIPGCSENYGTLKPTHWMPFL